MDKQQASLVITNIQYAQHAGADGRIQLNINGHINQEYYETSISVSDQVFSDATVLDALIKKSLLAARDKAQHLRNKS